jgi:hypothetical protein
MADSHETNTTSPQERPARPKLALRIGITGARSLDARGLDHLREKLREVLGQAKQITLDLSKEEAVAGVFAPGDKNHPAPPLLRFLSPLARGADRLAAEAALEHGYELFVPMPFPRAEYEEDFTGSGKDEEPKLSAEEDLARFGDLLDHKAYDWLALDGSRGSRAEMNRAYESVGRFVVRNSDLLIAIWDGDGEGGGRGGTAEIVRYARAGVPVCWINATKQCEPVWIAGIQDLRDLCCDTPPPGKKHKEKCQTLLTSYLVEQIRPPRPVDRDCHGPMKWLARRGQRKQVSPEAGYFANRLPPGHPPPPKPRGRPDSDVTAYWFGLYAPPDALAGENAVRYRYTYTGLFLLATLALILGAAAFLLHDVECAVLGLAGLEGLTLLGIAVLVIVAIHWEWHERSIEYRLLAELCRKQQVLALLGRAVSLGAVRHMETANRAAWVAWLFSAYLRAAPLPCGVMAEALSEIHGKDVLGEGGLIMEQSHYHKHRYKRASSKGKSRDLWGQRTFIAVCIFVFAKLAVTGVDWDLGWHSAWGLSFLANWGVSWGSLFGFLAIVLAAISAALVGIRSYAELPLLAEQSHHMMHELKVAMARVEALHLACPMASQDLGDETYSVAKLMLRDLEGWGLLFGTKVIEP